MYARGWRICGPDIREVFVSVPKKAYAASIMADAVYRVLNRCRTPAYVSGGQTRSKKEGALLALENPQPRWHALIRETLACCENDGTPGSMAVESFCREALADICAAVS